MRQSLRTFWRKICNPYTILPEDRGMRCGTESEWVVNYLQQQENKSEVTND